MSFIGLFLLGILLILFCTNQIVRLTTRLAYSFRISPLIVGLTIVAIGTSLPELVITTIATTKGDYGLGIGNIIGSNIINVLLVFGLGILFGKLKVGTVKTQRTNLFYVGTTLFYLASFYISISIIWFIGLAVLFTLVEIRWGEKGRSLEDKIRLKTNHAKPLVLDEYFKLILSLFMMYIGGKIVIQSIEGLSALFGYSTHALGLSLTAIATSLPEIFTTLLSFRQNQEKLLLGNILGSNVYNILLIGGIAKLGKTNYLLGFNDIFWLLFTAFCMGTLLILFKGKVIPRYFGVGLLLCSLLYLRSVYS